MSFFDTGSRIMTQPAILGKVFHEVNCVVLVGLGYLPFLIKAVTLFLLMLGYLSVRTDCVLDRVLPTLYSFARSL